MELQGTIHSLLPEVGGTGKSGNSWRKREFILETEGQYPKKVCISVWGDKIDQFPMREGARVTAAIDVESREYNGRWYTEVKAWKVALNDGANAGPAAVVDQAPDYGRFDPGTPDDLPF
ncbi:MAG: DUF3127 domain-containing protein [Bacteroidia bacterium]